MLCLGARDTITGDSKMCKMWLLPQGITIQSKEIWVSELKIQSNILNTPTEEQTKCSGSQGWKQHGSVCQGH